VTGAYNSDPKPFLLCIAVLIASFFSACVSLDHFGFLPGARFVLVLAFVIYVTHIVKVWLRSESAAWSGRSFELAAFNQQQPVSRAAAVENLRAQVAAGGQRPPRRVMLVGGFGGGGHAASLEALREAIREIGGIEFIEVPLGFMVETSDKNPFWQLWGITGECVYNWGLRLSGPVSFHVTWLMATLQHVALSADAAVQYVGRALFGLDVGDEAAKLCARVFERCTCPRSGGGGGGGGGGPGVRSGGVQPPDRGPPAARPARVASR
jgi:hypothetical protein